MVYSEIQPVSNLVSVDSVAELLPVTAENIMTTACLYRKENGVYPDWYTSSGTRGAPKKGQPKSMVDIDIINEQSSLVKKCWLLSTEYLYWWLTDKMKMTQIQLSEEMANRSKRFNTIGTWESFFNQGLFNLPQEVVLVERNNRLREFTIYGVAMVLAYNKRPVWHMPH